MTEAAAGHTIVDPVGSSDAAVASASVVPVRHRRASPIVVVLCGVGVGLAGFAGTFMLGRSNTATPAQGRQLKLSTPTSRVVPIVAPGLAAGVPALVKVAPKVVAVTPASPVNSAPARQPVYVAPTPKATVTVVAKQPVVKPAAKSTPSTQHTTTYYTTTFG